MELLGAQLPQCNMLIVQLLIVFMWMLIHRPPKREMIFRFRVLTIRLALPSPQQVVHSALEMMPIITLQEFYGLMVKTLEAV